MAELPRDTDSGKRTGEDSGAPRWVWILGISVAIVALLFVAMMFLGGGEHGPGQHTSPGGGDAGNPGVSVSEPG